MFSEGSLRRLRLLNGQPLAQVQAEPAVGRDVLIDERRERPPVLWLHRLLVARLGQHALNQQGVDELSREFKRYETAYYSALGELACSSMAAATSYVSSSARRNAWRMRATSISRAASCPAGSPRLLAVCNARSWLASIRRNTGTALFLGCACTHPRHTKPLGQCSPVGNAQMCVPISRRLQLAEKAAHSSRVGFRKLSSPCTAR